MQIKTTRAFRTISEAGEELDLQPHVLRFWESKFPQIKPMKRGGGRRFYRPEDIEFLRGIKVLLHDEKHPIKDVQKLIRVKGAGRVLELGRSVERAALPKAVKDVELIPERIANYEPEPEEPKVDNEILRPISRPASMPVEAKAKSSSGLKISPVVNDADAQENDVVVPPPVEVPVKVDAAKVEDFEKNSPAYIETEVDIKDVREGDVVIDDVVAMPSPPQMDKESLENALERLAALRGRWIDFKSAEDVTKS